VTQAETVTAVVIVLVFLAVCALSPLFGADSRFTNRPGRQI
jgi:preprotein translocase subunit SecE